jgi:uncharacterized membrane protein YczE
MDHAPAAPPSSPVRRTGLRAIILPVPREARTPRLVQLYVGLVIYGLSSSLLVIGNRGLVPWDVLHQGLSRQTGIAIGTWSIIVGLIVLLFWIPLRERPGLGTVSNAIVIGATMDVALAFAPEAHNSLVRWACALIGVVGTGVATGMYIGAGLGPGPRDGVMTGLARHTGASLRLVRTGIEAVVLALGWALGGTIGLATVIYLVSIGPLAHFFVPFFSRVPADGTAE